MKNFLISPIPKIQTLTMLQIILLCFYFWCPLVLAADIEANKMEILNTEEGKVTVFKDGVTILDGDTKIMARTARFYERKNLAIVQDSVKITNPSGAISCDFADYYLDQRKTILRGSVSVIQESLEIMAPELTVEYKKDKAIAKNGFTVIAKPHSLQITGKTGEYFLTKEEGTIDSLPYLEIKRTDTLKVSSQKLSFNNKQTRALAWGKVKVETGNAVLQCDTLIYNWEKDSGVALGSPLLKEASNEATGKEIYFFTKDGELQRIEIQGTAFGQYFNQQGDMVNITGESMNLLFSEGKTSSITARNVNLGKLYRHEEKP
ncbi:MAG: hypothetical protein OEZ20_05070 [candidate division WOR-3 bacterium]|nr:hypothetical protein [candidate division WOR-3 bacterium]